MLPKLSKRISQSTTQGLDGANESVEDQRQRRASSESTPLDSAAVNVNLEGGEEDVSATHLLLVSFRV